MSTILGISPGTKRLGFGLIKDGQLIEWMIRTYTGTVSSQKIAYISESISKMIKRENITLIAIKVPTPPRTSPYLERLIQLLKALGKKYNIKVVCYDIEDIKTAYGRRRNKMEIAEHIALQYPRVMHQWKRQLNNRTAYYIPMFESIAIASMAQKEFCE